MSKLFNIRQALKDSIVAADIGFTEDGILILRQTDLFNAIATAMSTSKHGTVLHIGVATGDPADDEDLEIEITVPITIIAEPELTEGATPEEDLWEALVKHVHDLRLRPEHPWDYRFRFKSFSDIDVEQDGTAYLGRQTVFSYKLSL